MPVDDISQVRNKLIGVSFLNEEEQKRVKPLWSAAFARADAFWVEAAPEDTTPAIAQKVFSEIRASGINNLSSTPCDVILFLDYSRGQQPNYPAAINGLSRFLQGSLFCSVPLELQFVFIGTNPIASSRADWLKQAVLELTQENMKNAGIQKRACLIAKNLLDAPDDIGPWESALFYLELLRRMNVADVLPAVGPNGNDDVCFLRYGRYDGVSYEALQAKLRELNQSKNAEGGTELTTQIRDRLQAIERAIRLELPISAKNQPLHPNLKVEGFFKIQSAKKGKNQEFIQAQMQTRNALLKTADTLAAEIRDRYAADFQMGSRQAFKALLEAAPVGIGLLSNRQTMKSLLEENSPFGKRPQLPSLQYNEKGYEGYAAEIDTYLGQVRDFAITEGVKQYWKSMLEGYLTITDEEIREKINAINLELAEVKAQLAAVPDEEAFLTAAYDGTELNANFSPIVPGGETKRVLVDSLPQDAERHGRIVRREVSVLLLSDFQAAGARGESKALQMLTFDCTRERLDDLIKEVEM